jgi:hypothetical protein
VILYLASAERSSTLEELIPQSPKPFGKWCILMSLWLIGVIASVAGSVDFGKAGRHDLHTLDPAVAFAFTIEDRDSADYDEAEPGKWALVLECSVVQYGEHRGDGVWIYLGEEKKACRFLVESGMRFGRAPPKATVG